MRSLNLQTYERGLYVRKSGIDESMRMRRRKVYFLETDKHTWHDAAVLSAFRYNERKPPKNILLLILAVLRWHRSPACSRRRRCVSPLSDSGSHRAPVGYINPHVYLFFSFLFYILIEGTPKKYMYQLMFFSASLLSPKMEPIVKMVSTGLLFFNDITASSIAPKAYPVTRDVFGVSSLLQKSRDDIHMA